MPLNSDPAPSTKAHPASAGWWPTRETLLAMWLSLLSDHQRMSGTNSQEPLWSPMMGLAQGQALGDVTKVLPMPRRVQPESTPLVVWLCLTPGKRVPEKVSLLLTFTSLCLSFSTHKLG